MPANPRQDLDRYRAKRDFARTPEPQGRSEAPRPEAESLSFVVQKHAASRLHWDFRLEWNGVLLSWAVTRGPSPDPSARRLAVRTEDHPLDYAEFEGTIPKGEYGGGTVMLWDRGTWEPQGDFAEGLRTGQLKIRLAGERMRGRWTLVRMKPRPREKAENWLLIKEHDVHESAQTEELVERHMTSVATGRTMEQIAAGKAPPRRTRKAALPAFRPLQLARLVSAAPEGEDWIHETKFDGYRCLAALAGGRARLYTRSGLDWTAKFGALVEDIEALEAQEALIDGEVIAPGREGGSFSELQARLKSGGQLLFMAFDLLALDGEDLTGQPLLARKERLETLIGKGRGAVRFSGHIRGHGPEVHERICAAGLEGIVSKRASAPYAGSRNGDWLKVKCTHRQEFVICGWNASDKPGRPFASLVMGSYEKSRLVYRGSVGSGFGAPLFRELKPLLAERAQGACPFGRTPAKAKGAHWLKPELVAEVSFTELTAEGHIRHGVFAGLRSDKDAREVRLEKPAPEKPAPRPRKARAGKKGTKTARPDAPSPDEPAPEPARKHRKSGGEKKETTMARPDDLRVAGIRISHPDRRIYDRPAVTKREVAEHAEALAPRMLRFLKDRPVSLLRCPDGAAGECFFQKHRTRGMPVAMKTVPVETKSGLEDFITLPDVAALVGATQMGTLEFHIWGSRNRSLQRPDRLVFDLDPDESLDFAHVRTAAAELRGLLTDLGLPSVPMLSGGKGVHVIVPLKPKAEWESVKLFSRALATHLAQEAPDRYTATMAKAGRKGRIFIDWLRNDRGSTAIAPYSLRARPGAPVATPVDWDELASARSGGDWTIRSIRDRLDRPCPLAEASARPATLGRTVIGRLERLVAGGKP
ncbi:DNA ligase D [Cereibacter sphaeroides]|uniref:DNA ligase D n=1 Tax=Cereibacter sphaeroides TaxID=1063 RepID=UPI00031ABF1A|nr:DNA ligase D [Cereibacter sphaeroides]